MAKRWTVLVGVVALLAAVWLLATAGIHERTSRAPPRAGSPGVGDAREPAPGIQDGSAGRPPGLAALPDPVDLDAVDRERDLHGIVVRKADGAPIAGAALQVVSYPWQRASLLYYDGYYETADGPATRSARDGTFSLRLRPGAEVALCVQADGYAPLELKARQPGERLRVEMQEGVRLTFVTRDENGNGVPGTSLRLWRTDGDAPNLTGVTDDEGRCAIGTVPGPAVYTVDVVPERLGYHSWEIVQVPESGEREHVVTLVEGRTITGRVIDADTGTAIPDAHIGMNWVMLPFTVSDAQGRYALPGWLGKGVNDIHCVADEYGRAKWVVDGDTHDFELSRGDEVTGRLLDGDGRPVVGAPVSSVGSTQRRGSQGICTRAGRSDAQGRFLLAGLRRDMPHTLVVMAEGFGRYLLDFDPHADRPGTIDLGDLTLPPARTIAGRVLSHAREPAPRIEVNLSGHNRDRGRLRGVEPDAYMFYGKSESRHTDDLGRFRFADLSPGSYTLEVRRPGAKSNERKLKLEEDLLDVEVVLADEREFRVIVVDEEGAAVPNVFVSVMTDGGGGGFNGQTDAMGSVTFFVTGRVSRVNAHPFASGRDLLPVDVPVENDGDAFRLVLMRGAKIEGRLLAEDGKPVAQAWVVAKRAGKQVASAHTEGGGTFSLDVPREGSFDIEFLGMSNGGAIERDDYVSEPVRAPAGATGVEIRVRKVERDRTLRVKVVLPDGSPVVGAWVFADRTRVDTDKEGGAAFQALPAREISVGVVHPRDRTDVVAPAFVMVVPAGQEITLALRRALTISGIVLMPDGSPAARASIQVFDKERLRYGAGSDDEGKFNAAVPADEPGPWSLQVQHGEHRGTASDVRTGDANLRIQLK